MKRQPQIDEMISFLEKKAPATLQSIRDENSSFLEILKEGSVMGEASELDKEELKVRAQICFAATNETVTKSVTELDAIRKKLKSSQRLQLYGQIITSVSGASVVTSLATNHRSITYIAGFLSLFGALIPLIVNSQRQTLNKDKNLEGIYEELVKLIVEARRNKQQLEYFIANDFNIAGISDVINRCNQLCYDIEERSLFS